MFVELFVTQGGEESADERAIGRFRDQVKKEEDIIGEHLLGCFCLSFP